MNNNIPAQFQRNMGIMTKNDYVNITESSVAIIGLGGLGGNIANLLVRLGVRELTLVDFDLFDETNLNRQLFSNHETIGNSKIEVIKKQLVLINPDCAITIFKTRIEELDISSLKDINYLIDAVDHPQTKIYISQLGNTLHIPVLHGACAGWYGQVGWILPGCTLIEEMYQHKLPGLEENLHNPSFTPSVIASVMASEFVKMIQHSDQTTINSLLLVDVYNHSIISTKGVK